MKKQSILFICGMCFLQLIFAQNVGINTSNPQAHLDIHGSNTRIQLTDDVSGNNATISRYTNRLEISPQDIFQISIGAVAKPNFIILPNGNIGVGNNTPLYPLHLQTPSGVDSWGFMHTNGNVYLGSFIYNSGIAEFGTRSNHPLYFFTNNSDAPPAIAIDKGGVNVGFGTTSPVNHLQIGNTPGLIGNDIAFGNAGQGTGLAQTATVAQWYTTTNIGLMPQSGTGFLGINTLSPTNKLQIGSVAGYAGNDIAFGNNGQASGISQTGTIAQWYSTTNISLMPMGNGHGRVGINTASPQAPLEVDDYVTLSQAQYNFFYGPSQGTFGNYSAQLEYSGGDGIAPQTSIYAQSNIRALEFDAYSDARIKDIKGVSNSANDLEILNKIEVTDYLLKDKAKYGNKNYKKVIAQQVESVYPIVVSKHSDFIPNVYLASNKITRTKKGWLVQFDSLHHISSQAKMLRVLIPGMSSMSKVAILSIPSNHEVEIQADNLSGGKIFIYGEEVDDFRTVDYEGLTTLNVSATQELSKQLNQQQQIINEQNEKIKLLSEKLEALSNEIKNIKQK